MATTHLPVNHRLRPLYRFLAVLAGAYVLVFGIVGVIKTAGEPFFDQNSATSVVGLRSNMAFAILSIVVGLVVLVATLIGRNIDYLVNLVAGVIFLVAGMLMMTVLQTNANFLNFQISTCVVSFVIGLVLFTAGLYGKTGSHVDHIREEHFRSHVIDDPDEHRWAFHGAPPRPVEDHPDGHRFA